MVGLPRGDTSITDGFYNLTFFKTRPGLVEPRMDLGLNHIVLQVDDLEEVERRYPRYRPRGPVIEEAGGIHHGNPGIHDPDGNPVSLSEESFGMDGRRQQVPGIRHAALDAIDTDAMLEFLHRSPRPS